jgi:hypothetical protein
MIIKPQPLVVAPYPDANTTDNHYTGEQIRLKLPTLGQNKSRMLFVDRLIPNLTNEYVRSGPCLRLQGAFTTGSPIISQFVFTRWDVAMDIADAIRMLDTGPIGRVAIDIERGQR